MAPSNIHDEGCFVTDAASGEERFVRYDRAPLTVNDVLRLLGTFPSSGLTPRTKSDGGI